MPFWFYRVRCSGFFDVFFALGFGLIVALGVLLQTVSIVAELK